ncbi:MAG TPA: IS200/IS605 family transposase [Polyangium sp.]|nr:IS200/IS605 family transposase [Polyangium sp.]
MSRAFTDLFVHVVWSTFGRTPWIVEFIEKPLYAMMTRKCQELECAPIALGGTSDHVHLLVGLAPTIAVATLVKEIKGASTHFVTHVSAPGQPFRWQRGYGAFSLRRADLPTVRDYIAKQKTHHLANTIMEEWEPPENDDSAITNRM